MITIDFASNLKEFVPEYIVSKHGNKISYDKNNRFHSHNDFPAIIYENGTEVWCNHGKKHRENDLPAVVWFNGRKEWWLDGKLCRANGLPAVIYPSGHKEYWINNRFIKSEI